MCAEGQIGILFKPYVCGHQSDVTHVVSDVSSMNLNNNNSCRRRVLSTNLSSSRVRCHYTDDDNNIDNLI